MMNGFVLRFRRSILLALVVLMSVIVPAAARAQSYASGQPVWPAF